MKTPRQTTHFWQTPSKMTEKTQKLLSRHHPNFSGKK